MNTTNTVQQMKDLAKETALKIQNEKKELQKKAVALFKETTTAFFEQHLDIRTMGWKQYEPWRDGEETEFEVFRDEESVYVNGVSLYDYENDEYEKKWRPMHQAVARFLKEFPDDVLESCFGHGSAIEIDRNGMTVKEYEDG